MSKTLKVVIDTCWLCPKRNDTGACRHEEILLPANELGRVLGRMIGDTVDGFPDFCPLEDTEE